MKNGLRLWAMAGILAFGLGQGSAAASLITFAVTGVGSGGTNASAHFTIEDGNNATYYTPGYFATGGIYNAASLTLSNIPGNGPSGFTAELNDLQSTWFEVDSNGVQYLAPYGSHNFGPPDQNHYDLGQPSQPNYPASYTFQTVLSYNGQPKDTITWFPASIVGVPEPATLSLIVPGFICLGAALVQSWRRRDAS